MYTAVETKCTELFGTCPLNLQDMMAAKVYGYTEEELLLEAARKFYMSEKNAFFDAICQWSAGEKMQITHIEAKKRNEHYKNARRMLDEKLSAPDTPVNWAAFPNDDPTITFYLGLPVTDDLCVWAQQYKQH